MMKMGGLLITVLSFSIIYIEIAHCLEEKKNYTTYLSRLISNYDKDVRPLLGVHPVNVGVEIQIDSIGIIEEAKMEIPLYFFLRQFWNDERLAGKVNRTVVFTGGVIGNFWKPDLYCYNARQSNIMVDDKDVNSRLSIHNNGDMEYSRGSTIVASCEMNLHKFPMDTQHCRLTFGSYSQSDSDILFSWKRDEIIIDNPELSQFAFMGITLDKKTTSYDDGKINYTAIYFSIKLQRRSGYYIIQAYCPDILIVSLSWIILWMDAGAIGDRLSLGITTILTVVFLLGSINAYLPKVSYAKALDWYLIVSFIFVFLTLVESMIVFLILGKQAENTASSYKEKSHRSKRYRIPLERIPMVVKKDQHMESEGEATHPNGHEESQPEVSIEPNFHGNAESYKAREIDRKSRKKTDKALVKCAKFIDKFSRFLFPFSFLVFNIVYWYHFTNE